MSDDHARAVENGSTRSAYWYSGEARSQRGRAVLQALREYREAEMAMRKRTQGSMGMNETDLAALRHVMAATSRAEHVSPKDLARHLDITPASVSTLLERLERAGHLLRVADPDDARRVRVECTELAHREVRATLRDMHSQMMVAVEDLTPDEAATVVRFLEQLRTSVERSVGSDSAA